VRTDRAILWFRQDLRIDDNPALIAGCRHAEVVPCFIWVPEEEGDWPAGAASRWWLHQSLRVLDEQLRQRGSRLIVRAGDSLEVLRELARDAGADAVYWNRRYEPAVVKRDRAVEAALSADGVRVETFNSALLYEPDGIRTKSGQPYQVFTPFWRACTAKRPDEVTAGPARIPGMHTPPKSLKIDELGLLPDVDWAAGMRATWRPGCVGAQERLDTFVAGIVRRYDVDRNRMDIDGTSSLSPHLHFGEIGPRQVWHAVTSVAGKGEEAARVYLAEIGWREFAYHLLVHFPETVRKPLREKFDGFPWRRRKAALSRWQRGQTGYPVVDAAMRQLWHTGWMHNRARMIVASFLTKDLLIPWQDGAAWFWDTLVDADLASNTLGWQWTAGCGADAAPFFRIFNPVTQAEKFDPEGAYIRRWVPELAALPVPWIFKPWEAPKDALASAGVTLGKTYPKPMVDHGEARSAALAAFEAIK